MVNKEQEASLLSPENKKIISPFLSFGFSSSNFGNHNNSDYILPTNLDALINLASSQKAGIELQLEPERGTMKLPETTLDTSTLPFFGIHLPIMGVDMARASSTKQNPDFLLFDRTIKMAADLNATYIVSHLREI